MKELILAIFDIFNKRRPLFWFVLIFTCSILSVLSFRISFEEDISKMLQMDEKTREYSTIIKNTKLADKLIVSVSFDNPTIHDENKLILYADSIENRLTQTNKGLIKKITLKSDDLPFTDIYNIILQNLPLFLQPEDYKTFDSLLSEKAISKHLESNLKLLSSPAGLVVSQTLKYDPIGISIPILNRLKLLGGSTGYEIVDGYFFTNGHHKLVFFINPANPPNETGKNTKLISNLNQQISYLKLRPEFKYIHCVYFGATAVAVGNSVQIQRDTYITLFALIAGIILLITLVFKKKRTPLLIFSPVIFGLIFALAIIAFIKPSISIIAIGATSVLLGIAVNYPIHILTHCLHEKDLKKVVANMVIPMTIGSATTIGGFLCLLFVKAEILHDLGLLGAFSLIGAALFSLIFLPHLIGQTTNSNETNTKIDKFLLKAGQVNLEKKKFPILLIVVLTPVLFYFCQNIEFDSDLNHLNFMTPELKKAEAELQGSSNISYSMYIVSFGKTTDEALKAASHVKSISDSLNNKGINNAYTGISSFIPYKDLQKQKIELWNKYWTTERKNKLFKNLGLASKTNGFKDSAFNNFISIIKSPGNYINPVDNNVLLETLGGDLITSNAKLTTIVSVLKIPTSKVNVVASSLSKQSGTTLLDRKFMANQLLKIINNDFNFIAIFSAILVFFALLLTYGRIELALTVFIPMVVSWIWILGLMGIFHLKFNLVNIILSTFIFGLGDDYCIFIMDGLLQEYKTGKKQLSVIKISIILSGLTTLIGFGVLFLAKHPALQSIAALSVIGILSVLFISQTLEPLLFKLFIKNQVDRKYAPITALTFFKSVIVFTFFITGSLLLTLLGFVLVIMNPVSKKWGRKILNILISKFQWAQLYMMPSVVKNIVYVEKPDYKNPFIIICNHQSVLDNLLVGMLSPKIIQLTNKWVWNSPVFGYVVRMAGYYPIIEGVETSLSEIKRRIDEGYSIVIFPEGTRSKDGKIQRFHKGAFYLAEQLNLDIVPIIIHDTGKCLQKSSFVLRDMKISVKVLPRIKASDISYGTSYQQRAKTIASYFKDEYKKFASEIEIPDHFKRRLIDNYLFKGPILEWYMKIKLRMENNYQQFHSLVPLNGKIVDAGCGYGFMSYMLAYLSAERNITAIDYDHDKIEVAKNGFGLPSNLQFEYANVADYNFPDSDCIIFSDVLHYLSTTDLEKVLSNCYNRLTNNGIIIIRDADTSKTKKHSSTKLSEVLSTKIFRFNKTQNNLGFFSLQELSEVCHKIGFLKETKEYNGWASNTITIFRKA